jgi:hypothetical protein
MNKKGKRSVYSYTVVRESEDAPWQLQRAWEAAPNGRVLKEYQIRAP